MRTYCKEFTMRLGPATTIGELVPMRLTEPKFKFATPDFKPVHQAFIDDDGRVIRKEDLQRAAEVKIPGGKELIPIPLEDLNTARESKLEKNIIDLTVHPVEDVDLNTFPSDNQAYVFHSVRWTGKRKDVVLEDAANDGWRDYIFGILQEPTTAVIGKSNLQGYEGLFRLGIHRGHIFLQKQLYPEGMNRFDFDAPSLSADLVAAARATARKLAVEFEPAKYEDGVTRRLQALQGIEVERAAPVAEFDLMSQFKAAMV